MRFVVAALNSGTTNWYRTLFLNAAKPRAGGLTGCDVMETQEQIKEETVVDVRKERKCLMCGTRFESDGAHNRICPKCKSTEAWRRG